MVRRLWIVLVIALLACVILPVSAQQSAGATFTMDCNGFAGASGGIQLTRDNTRNNREAFVVSATDGAGNVIYQPVEDSFFVGGSVSWVGADKVQWTQTPQYNPLVLRVVSRAGNGFGESLITMAMGECKGLSAYGVLPAGVFVVDGDTLVLSTNLGSVPIGSTSPAVVLNGVPPRPTNEDELIYNLPAYFFVNIDNLSVRSGAGPDYTLIAIVDGGTRLIPLGRNEDRSWWYVQVGDIVGWVKGEFLLLRGDATDVPVVPSLGEIAQPRVFIHVVQPVYGLPDADTLPMCSITNDQEYYVVGRDADTEWYQVQVVCDGTLVNGWIPAEFVSIRNPGDEFISVTD